MGGNVPISQLQGQGDTVSFWDPGNASDEPLVKINLEQQGKILHGISTCRVSKVSSGRGFGTPPGSLNTSKMQIIFRIWSLEGPVTVVNDDVDSKTTGTSSRFNLRRCTYTKFYGVQGGVGMHAGYIPDYQLLMDAFECLKNVYYIFC